MNDQEPEKWCHGQILSYINKDKWFAFIKSKYFDENIYFDQRSYKGETRKLLPGQDCRFIVSSKIKNGEKIFFAKQVELL